MDDRTFCFRSSRASRWTRTPTPTDLKRQGVNKRSFPSSFEIIRCTLSLANRSLCQRRTRIDWSFHPSASAQSSCIKSNRLANDMNANSGRCYWACLPGWLIIQQHYLKYAGVVSLREPTLQSLHTCVKSYLLTFHWDRKHSSGDSKWTV